MSDLNMQRISPEIRRHNLSIDKKLQIIREAASGKKRSLIAHEFGIRPQTICDLLHRHAHRLQSVLLEGRISLHAKRVRQSLFPEVDDALWQWFVQQRQGDGTSADNPQPPLTRFQLYSKANEIARTLAFSPDAAIRDKYTGVVITQSWIDRWRNRRNVYPYDIESIVKRRITTVPSSHPKVEPNESFTPPIPLPPFHETMSFQSSSSAVSYEHCSSLVNNDFFHTSSHVPPGPRAPSPLVVPTQAPIRTTNENIFVNNRDYNDVPTPSVDDTLIPTVNDALHALTTLQCFLDHKLLQENMNDSVTMSTSSLLSSSRSTPQKTTQHYLQCLHELRDDLTKRNEKSIRQTRITHFFNTTQ